MLCGGVAACHKYGMCTVRCVARNIANSTHSDRNMYEQVKVILM